MASRLPQLERNPTANEKDGERRSVHDSQENYEYISPFRLPSDDEVFVYREAERQKKTELKKMANDLKIWEKKTGTSRQPLRLFKNTELPPVKDSNRGPKTAFNSKDKAIILEAQKIINERRKNRETGLHQKEGVLELLEQKKEMFLVEMTVGIIENERKILIQKEDEKREALKKSEEMLEKDFGDFGNYLQNNDQEKKLAISKCEREIEERKRAEFEFKKKKNEETSLKAEKTKNEELIQKYLTNKEFLDSLTPREFIDARERRINEFVEEFRNTWIERELNILEDNQSVITDSTMTKGIGSMNARLGNTNNTVPISDRSRLPNKRTLKQMLEEKFNEKLHKGELDEVEDFRLNQKMYFHHPNQLIEIFAKLEENNLNMIQMMQDAEQNLENLKSTLAQRKKEFDEKIGGLRDNKMQLDKKKNDKENRIRYLEAKRKEDKNNKKKDELLPLTKKIIDVYVLFREDMGSTTDMESMTTLELLAAIEVHLEKQLKTIKNYNPTLVGEKKKKCEDDRKKRNRIEQKAEDLKRSEEKSKMAALRISQPAKKRKGRLDMGKSAPLEKREIIEEVSRDNGEEEDMKYYQPYLNDY
jgi:hypothetical protein